MNDGRLKVFLIPLQIFLAHLPGIENMDLCLSVINLLRERRCQIRPDLVFDAFFCDEAHVVLVTPRDGNECPVVRIGICHLAFISLLHQPGFVAAGMDKMISDPDHQRCRQVCLEGARLIHIRAAEDTHLHMDVMPRGKMRDKGAAKGTAIGSPDRPVVMLLYAGLDLFQFVCDGSIAFRIGFVEACVRNGSHMEILTQLVYYASEIPLPIAHRPRQKQNHRLRRVAKFVNCHCVSFLEIELLLPCISGAVLTMEIRVDMVRTPLFPLPSYPDER